MKVLIDNGHGVNTPGKRSPDGRLREYKYCREIAVRVVEELKAKGIDAERIVTEEADISLQERCRRVNAFCRQHGSKKVMLVSIHNNAAGHGQWKTASGWCGYVYTGASEASRKLAQSLYAAAEKRGLKGNRSVPKTKYWTAGFYILKHTACPAVLTENLFQDNKEEVDFLLSEKGRQTITDLHVEGILSYLQSLK
ncbi:MAG: N-acetylmuramoyl-L-alanine amidase [Bacteroidaceae bacterium]|nr:N-acetylmuramoyl-L-alanine amidase [Bacteroidaceae bacterium]